MKNTMIFSAILAAGSLLAAPSETVIQDAAFNYVENAAKVNDPAASDKSAGKMDSTKGWTLTYSVPKTLFGARVMSISLRTDCKDPKGAFSVGVYNRKTKKIVLVKRLKAVEYAKDSYQDVSFSKWDFKEGDYIFIGSILPKNVAPGNIFVDKISFKPEPIK